MKGQKDFEIIIFVVILAVLVLFATGRLFSTYDLVTPKALTNEVTIATGTPGQTYSVEYACPSSTPGLNQLDYCLLKISASTGNIQYQMKIPPGQSGLYQRTDNSASTMACQAYTLGPHYCGGTPSISLTETAQHFTLHYTGNGICEAQAPYNETYQNAPQDCVAPPTSNNTSGGGGTTIIYICQDGIQVSDVTLCKGNVTTIINNNTIINNYICQNGTIVSNPRDCGTVGFVGCPLYSVANPACPLPIPSQPNWLLYIGIGAIILIFVFIVLRRR